MVGSNEELVLLYVCMLRALGLSVRLILSFRPMTYKADNLEAVSVLDEFMLLIFRALQSFYSKRVHNSLVYDLASLKCAIHARIATCLHG